jgi:alpha-L-fucosidase
MSGNRHLDEFLKLKFGMFIHYNMATYLDCQWAEGYSSPERFDPGGVVDTDAWADAAVEAGMTYGVLTAKHVGGFCLWESELTRYSVKHPSCPYQEDLVAQFVRSFTSRGLKVGLYYCWRNPGFDDQKDKVGKYKVIPPECDPEKSSFEEQIEFQKKQIAELRHKFPEVFYIWNDALDPRVMSEEKARNFFTDLDPNLVCCGNWWDWGKKGDSFLDLCITEKKELPQENLSPGETCWVLEDGWFWQEKGETGDPEKIYGRLLAANQRNANFLLNVGPDKSGKIIPSSLKALQRIGELRKNSELTKDGYR